MHAPRRACRRSSAASRGSDDRRVRARGRGSGRPAPRSPTAPRRWRSPRSAAARWRSRPRTATWPARSRDSRRCRRTRSRRSSGGRDSPSAYLLVSTEPCASSTALGTKFSLAIISSVLRWRPSSCSSAAATSDRPRSKGTGMNRSRVLLRGWKLDARPRRTAAFPCRRSPVVTHPNASCDGISVSSAGEPIGDRAGPSPSPPVRSGWPATTRSHRSPRRRRARHPLRRKPARRRRTGPRATPPRRRRAVRGGCGAAAP